MSDAKHDSNSTLTLNLVQPQVQLLMELSEALGVTCGEVVTGAWESTKSELHIFTCASSGPRVLEASRVQLPLWLQRPGLELDDDPRLPDPDEARVALEVGLSTRVRVELEALATHGDIPVDELVEKAIAFASPALLEVTRPNETEPLAQEAQRPWWRLW